MIRHLFTFCRFYSDPGIIVSFVMKNLIEILKKRAEQVEFKGIPVVSKQSRRAPSSSSGRSRSRQSAGEATLKSAARSIGSQIGRQIIRGIMGSVLGGRR